MTRIMSDIITLTAHDGSTIEFVNQIIGSGAMKDVYFSPDKSYVVGFFRQPQTFQAIERLENITGVYRDKIFKQAGGDYWKDLFCWPTTLVEWEGKIGVVCPAYDPCFFFHSGNLKGKEKEGKWFASAKLRNRILEAEDKGSWLTHLKMCIQIARAVKRMHAAGLAHSDLSYKNVLVDPCSGRAAIIDIDGLVVPGKFPPDVVGTPDFIAPEVLASKSSGNMILPSIRTDRHALATLIYMYLLYRHPLRGGKIHDPNDPALDEELSMGKHALFIEHPADKSNRPKIATLHPAELPQGDINKLPYTICGPFLKELFDRAFIHGLHEPNRRPTADEWEQALIHTVDLLQPCENPDCEYHWFVFDNTRKPVCPFCGTAYTKPLPVLNFYFRPKLGANFRSEGLRLMVYDKQSLYPWHVDRFITPNEKLAPQQKQPVADFHFHQGKWMLINRKLTSLYDRDSNTLIPQGQAIELTEGKKIQLSTEEGGRLIVVQLVE